jgi:hypothetical protein
MLKNLDLGQNSLISGHPGWFQNKMELKTISLSKNELQTMFGMFEGAKNLESLDLSHNNLGFIEIDEFAEFEPGIE